MSYGFLDTLDTPGVRAAQTENGVRGMWEHHGRERPNDRFTERETAFMAQRDSFYVATVSESGWPYVQHRGGPPGFLKVLDDQTLAFADFRGNRQYLSLGNLSANDRVALIMVDYPHQRRLKILAHAQLRDLRDDPALAEKLALPGYRALPERAIVLRLQAFDWNCPQHITPRYTLDDIKTAVAPLHARIEALEAELQALREQQTASDGGGFA